MGTGTDVCGNGVETGRGIAGMGTNTAGMVWDRDNSPSLCTSLV